MKVAKKVVLVFKEGKITLKKGYLADNIRVLFAISKNETTFVPSLSHFDVVSEFFSAQKWDLPLFHSVGSLQCRNV